MKQAIKIISPDLFKLDGDWKDFYLEIKDLKKGDVFYESDNRNAFNYELKAIDDARKTNNGYACKVKTLNGEIVELYMSANTTYVGPNLFKIPQILDYIDGKYVYVII